jgi:hypothetical protein
VSWEIAKTTTTNKTTRVSAIKVELIKINEMNEAIETLNPNPTGTHSRAEGLTSHRKRVLRRQSRGWHEA